MAKGDLLLKAVHPRRVLAASAGAWTAAEILHLAHVAPLDPALVSVAVAGVMYGTRARPATGLALAAGAWLTVATVTGPLAGPHDAMTLGWAGATAAGLAWIHRHDAVQAAKRWQAARREWQATAHSYGLGGSHLIEHEDTRLGERHVLDVTGTGKLASQLASGHLAERIAQDHGLPVSRVKVRPGRIAGRLEISTRFRDPWKHPITHPLFDDDPELDLPVPCTIREPLPVGQDPELGTPLNVTVWDGGGAKNLLIIGKRESGKTVLGNCIRERVTAATDAVLWDINCSKAAEDREWAPACQHSAVGPAQRRKALTMLIAAYKIVTERGARPRDTTVFEPTPADPLIVIFIDEAGILTDGNDWIAQQTRKLLKDIASQGRSEAVTLIEASQRGTAAWVGGSDVRALLDYVCIGKVSRRGEIMHAAGDMGLALPDMATYGEGKPGVWVVAEVGGDYQVGRTFNLRELTDIRKLAAERDVNRVSRPVMAAAAPGGYDASPAPGDPAHPEPEDTSGIGHLDESMEAALPDDLRERLRKLGEKNEQTRQVLDETSRALEQLPAVDPAALAASTEERWSQAAKPPPDDAREALLRMLGEGTTISRAADALGQTKWTVRCWLEWLRIKGLARTEGKGRGSRWRLIQPGPGGDAP